LASYLQYCALSDAAIQQSEWNASKFREKLICDMLSEMMAKYKVFPSLISQSVSVLGSMYVTLLNQIIKSCYVTPA
jgi:hypothetical protein